MLGNTIYMASHVWQYVVNKIFMFQCEYIRYKNIYVEKKYIYILSYTVSQIYMLQLKKYISKWNNYIECRKNIYVEKNIYMLKKIY
jgi:hypothetical protein